MHPSTNNIKLTSFAHGAGCGCKIAPKVLEEILQHQTHNPFDQLLVGNDLKDDAAVFELNDEQCIIATTDFFTPIVDDPFIYGKAAAANALSDVYAMGGQPLLALAILGWPVEKLPASIAARVIEGAREICNQAGIPLAGGHSIDAPEPIFGLAVNGLVQKNQIKRNATAKVGDFLVLTKPIGVGILATAAKRDAIDQSDLEILHQSLTELNQIGKTLSQYNFVHAITDVTGFGLVGHAIEMAEASKVGIELEYHQIPILPSALNYASKNIVPDATYRNWNAYQNKIKFAPGVNVMEAFKLLPDPQTNGGLLIAIAPEKLSFLQKQHPTARLQVIGRIVEPTEQTILIQP